MTEEKEATFVQVMGICGVFILGFMVGVQAMYKRFNSDLEYKSQEARECSKELDTSKALHESYREQMRNALVEIERGCGAQGKYSR